MAKRTTIMYLTVDGKPAADNYTDGHPSAWYSTRVGDFGCMAIHRHTNGGNDIDHVKTYAAGVWREVITDYV